MEQMSPPPPNKRRLGRGLSALIPGAGAASVPAPADQPRDEPRRAPGDRRFVEVAVADVYPSPDQPRRQFDDQLLDELADSIREHGVIQPVVVRPRPDTGYFLIAGERRWRAAQRAGLLAIPAVIQTVSAQDAFERALVENIQRADLNPIEEAAAYQRLVDDFDYSQEQVAQRVGKDRTTVTNSIRLLRLPRFVRELVEARKLSMGHARALLGLDSPGAIETAARKVIADGLSVRQTEAMVRKQARGDDAKAAAKPTKSADVRNLEERLTRSLGARVAVQPQSKGKGGRIEIRYADLDDLDRLLDVLLR